MASRRGVEHCASLHVSGLPLCLGDPHAPMTENSIDLTCLVSAMSARVRNLPSCNALHDLGKAHRLVNARDRKREVLHHASHSRVGVTGVHHVLHGRRRVDLHRAEVREAGHGRRVAPELLAERIAEVVRWVGRAVRFELG